MAARDDADAHLPLKHHDFLVLAALHAGALHGYRIVQEIAARTEGRVRLRPGNLYRVLVRLEQSGLCEESGRRPAAVHDDERRTYYRLTALGRAVLAAEARMLAGVISTIRG